MHHHRMYTLLLQKIIRKKDDTPTSQCVVLSGCCKFSFFVFSSSFRRSSFSICFSFFGRFGTGVIRIDLIQLLSVASFLSWLSRISNYSGLYSALLQEARKVIKIIPEKDTMKNNIIPLALAVAKSVHNAPWTASTYKELMLGHDRAS